jgi:arginase family enzyme
MQPLNCEITTHLNNVSPEELRRLFPHFPEPIEILKFLPRSGFDNFSLHFLIIRKASHIILILPIFDGKFEVASFLEGNIARLMMLFSKWFPRLFCPRVLGVSVLEGDWGEIGWERGENRTVMGAAWDLALCRLEEFAKESDTDILAFVNFNERSGQDIPLKKLFSFTQMHGVPCAQVALPFKTLEEYLGSLSKNSRKNLKRQTKNKQMIQILRTSEPGAWIDAIYDLYRKSIKKSDLVFGIQNKAYFERVCAEVPGAEYVLYFLDGKLLAFNLVFRTKERLLDKYFGMDPHLGKEHSLFFFSWLENISFCIRNGIPLYHVGQMAEKIKMSLGAQLIPSAILFRHRVPLFHRFLTGLQKFLSYEPEIKLPGACLGRAWEDLVVIRSNKSRKKSANDPWFILGLDMDGSLRLQEQVVLQMDALVDLRKQEQQLRLWPEQKAWESLEKNIWNLREKYPKPWITLLGSGDLHHVSYLLLATLPLDERPVKLILIDNHPDWYNDRPHFHCGNWLSQALRLPWISGVVMAGQDSSDIAGRKFWNVPFRELREGRVRLFPYDRKLSRVLLRYPSSMSGIKYFRRRFYGSDLYFETLMCRGVRHFFQRLAKEFRGENVYLSIDKDCLEAAAGRSDWDHGKMKLEELLAGLQELSSSCCLVGADLCGEQAPQRLRGFSKNWNAGRFPGRFSHSEATDRLNEKTNLRILDALNPACADIEPGRGVLKCAGAISDR